MLYIFSIIAALSIFISIFFIKTSVSAYMAAVFFIIDALIESPQKAVKSALRLSPYFIAVFIIQALNARGEYYNIFGFYIDKTGADFTIAYFIKILAALYFISIFFAFIKNLKVPKGVFFDEMIRINIFMNIVKKSFFSEFNKIKNKDKSPSLKDKLNLVNNLLENVYIRSFKLYPYDAFIEKYRIDKK